VTRTQIVRYLLIAAVVALCAVGLARAYAAFVEAARVTRSHYGDAFQAVLRDQLERAAAALRFPPAP
jgi:hypothetical protein